MYWEDETTLWEQSEANGNADAYRDKDGVLDCFELYSDLRDTILYERADVDDAWRPTWWPAEEMAAYEAEQEEERRQREERWAMEAAEREAMLAAMTEEERAAFIAAEQERNRALFLGLFAKAINNTKPLSWVSSVVGVKNTRPYLEPLFAPTEETVPVPGLKGDYVVPKLTLKPFDGINDYVANNLDALRWDRTHDDDGFLIR